MNRTKLLTIVSTLGMLFSITSCQENDPTLLPATSTTSTATLDSQTTGQQAITNFIYKETMEGLTPFSTADDLDVGDWDYAMQFVKAPYFRGLKSARFEIREDQPLVANGKRSEVTIVKGSKGHITKNAWYSFAVYFPSVGYEYDDERECINQWFQDRTPATSLRTHRDRILLESGNTEDNRKKYDIGPIAKNRWHTFVMHFIHSYGSDGLIELWYDGTKKLTIRGGNMYDNFLPKWKIGLYKSAFKDGTSDVTRRIIYFDNIKVGNDKATYETMRPAYY